MRDAFRRSLAKKYPTFEAEGGRELCVQAQVEDTSAPIDFASVEAMLAALTPSHAVDLALASVKTAAGMLGADGKPRMLRVTAWMCHANGPNGNGDAFLAEDLQAAAEGGLFTVPNVGMMDFNHWFESVGIWYSAKYAHDPVADAPGLLVEGVMFAWAYPTLADKMLAEQQRKGFIAVSMACIPKRVEYATTAEGREHAVLREPVFFANSLLDVPPADADGRGTGSEDPEQTAEERETLLRTVASAIQTAAITPPPTPPADSAGVPDLTKDTPTLTEGHMTFKELIAAFAAAVSEEQRTQFAPLIEAAQRLSAVEADLVAAQTALATATSEAETAATTAAEALTARQAEVTTLTARVTTLEAEAAEATVTFAAQTTALTAAEAELVTLRAFKAAADTAAADAEVATRRAARLAELSAPALAIVMAQADAAREKMVTRWTEMSDEEWAVVRDSMNIAKTEGKYEAASAKEGPLAAGATETKHKYEIDRFVS